MASGIFRGEEDIDKSQIIITKHAVEQFYKRSVLNKQQVSNDFEKIKEIIRKLLNLSTHKNAIDKLGRVRCLIDHGESYFFRNQHWQFIVHRSKSEPDKFVLVTVVYLQQREYDFCFKK